MEKSYSSIAQKSWRWEISRLRAIIEKKTFDLISTGSSARNDTMMSSIPSFGIISSSNLPSYDLPPPSMGEGDRASGGRGPAISLQRTSTSFPVLPCYFDESAGAWRNLNFSQCKRHTVLSFRAERSREISLLRLLLSGLALFDSIFLRNMITCKKDGGKFLRPFYHISYFSRLPSSK